MAVDMFFDIKGVKGESKDEKHKDKIDVLAWSWGTSNSSSGHVGGGAGAGKVNVQDLSFTKYVDLATPNLLQHCCSGAHFEEAKLTVRKAGGKNPLEYLTIDLHQVFVTSVSTGGSGGEDRLTENVTLNFSKFKLEYKEQDDKGGSKGAHSAGWNIAANKSV